MQEDISPQELFESDQDTLLIIGNGFDLDLGLNTRFLDFAESDKWPFKNISANKQLGAYLNKCAKDSWFDLEHSMKSFCLERSTLNSLKLYKQDFVESVRKDDALLNTGLVEYLEQAEKGKLDIDSYASKILRECDQAINPPAIYSFNYTDLKTIARRLGYDFSIRVTYVHGSLQDKSIVLGFDEMKEIPGQLLFMSKSRRDRYSSSDLFDALKKHKVIVFFGISFNIIDFGYFSDFFDGVSTGRLKDKVIRVITLDETSHQDILNRISQNVNTSIFEINRYSDFKVIKTSGHSNSGEFQELYNKINPEFSIDPRA